MRTCPGACGNISRNAKVYSSSYILNEGISQAMILEKREGIEFR